MMADEETHPPTVLPAREDVAVIGMAGRFPGARNLDEFWRNLREGVEAVRSFTPEELAACGVDPAILRDPDYVNAGAVLDDPEWFAASFFGYAPREAELTDPQQRVFLECAWEALEAAGYDPARAPGAVSVYAGIALNTYFQNNLLGRPELAPLLGQFQMTLGNEKDFVATRVAYKLNLRGASFTVQTGCSTSLVATHLACQALLAGECDMAIVGGGRIRVPLTAGYLYVEGGVPSPDGHCRAFDAEARGCVAGSGMAAVVLKRLSDARRDGDTIRAVIKGSAINNDGADKMGFTAPSVSGQAAAIAQALAMADVDADTIGYVEAHGTGTSLGDPIEVAALTQAYRAHTDRRGFCRLGSVKTNIGHLDAGAGVAGLIKTILAIERGEIPPSLHFRSPNPQIDFANSPFVVNAALTPWPETDGPRRAGVSSFGIGGTNAHVIVEGASAESSVAAKPSVPLVASHSEAGARGAAEGEPQVIVLSAKSASALDRMSANLAAHLRRYPDIHLADVAYTLQVGRGVFAHRRALVCGCADEAAALLEAPDPRRVWSSVPGHDDPPVVFLFPGGGAQHPRMGVELYQREPVYRGALDRCLDSVQPRLGLDLRTLLFPSAGDETAAARELERPSRSLPSLFATEYALARLWMTFGIQPAAMLGHSMGEYVAACLAGVFTPEEGMALVLTRGELFDTLPEGGMLSVPLPEAELKELLGPDLSLGAVNAPELCMASGAVQAIAALEARLAARGLEGTRIHIDVAAHSTMVEPILEEFARVCRTINLRSPDVPFVSNLTGTWITDAEATDPAYWVQHLRHTVRFADGLRTLLAAPERLFVEVGPGRTLAGLAKQQVSEPQRVLTTMRHPKEEASDVEVLRQSVARLWLAGGKIDWDGLHGHAARRRVTLPTYPFERTRHWIDPVATTLAPRSSPSASPLAIAGAAASANAFSPLAPAVAPRAGSSSTPSSAHIEALAAVAAAPAAVPPAVSAPGPAAIAAPPRPRRERIAAAIKRLLHEMSGVDVAALDEHATWLALGYDSLFLTQANAAFHKTFKVRTTFRQLFEQTPTIDTLAGFFDEKLPPEAFADPAPPSASSHSASVPPPPFASVQVTALSASAAGIHGVSPAPFATVPAGTVTLDQLAQQVQAIAAQLDALRQQQAGVPSSLTSAPPHPSSASAHAPAPVASAVPVPASMSAVAGEAPRSIGPWKPLDKGVISGLTARQQQHIDALIDRYCRKTASSKRMTQDQRARLADPRSVSNFRQVWKEMVYQIAVTRSRGSRLWDVDGNEYVDVTMGFSVNLFGFSPDFVTRAIEAQLQRGIEIGVLAPQTRQVADAICDLTGVERVCFVNTGSEANMAALRAARTVTGRDRVAVFAGAYHGIFDEALVKPVRVNGERRSMPVAPGIPASMVQHVTVLNYGDPASLDLLRREGHDFAAVFVEPVQTRHPDLQPREFLHALRAVTRETGTALIFDEVVTGFRLHPRGAQGWYGLDADLVSYGKLIGGGMPMAVVAGKAQFMDAFDGGMWRFGDDSFPEAGVTFFGGTFVKHPLALAASAAVLEHLRESGPALYDTLNRRAEAFAHELNTFFLDERLPLHLERGGSIFCLTFPGADEHARLLFFHLREKGVHIYDRPFSISTAHTDADLALIVKAVRDSVREMRDAGFFGSTADASTTPMSPTSTASTASTSPAASSEMPASLAPLVPLAEQASPGRAPVPAAALTPVAVPSACEPHVFPLTEAQLEVWLGCQFAEDASLVFNESSIVHLPGTLDAAALGRAVQRLIARHEALRTTFSADGHHQRVATSLTLDVPLVDLSQLPAPARAARREALIHTASDTRFDLEQGPPVRMTLLRLAATEHELLLTCHHLVCDGVSFGVLLSDLAALYTAECEGRPAALAPATPFRAYAAWHDEQCGFDEDRANEAYWHDRFLDGGPVIDLPTDGPRPGPVSHDGAVETLTVAGPLLDGVKQLSAKTGNTVFCALLTAYYALLHRLTGQDDIVIGISSSGQAVMGAEFVGHSVNFLPLRIAAAETLRDQMQAVRGVLLDAFDHQLYTFGRLVRTLKLPRDPGRMPLVAVSFNLDPKPHPLHFGPITTVDRGVPKRHVNLDLQLNVVEAEGRLRLDCAYLSDVYDAATVRRWMGYYVSILETLVGAPETAIAAIPLLGEMEREQVLIEWNRTARDYPRDASIHQLFEAQAARTPHAIATACGDRRLSYRELNDRADAIARLLRQHGVACGTLVGLCVERSTDMVAGLLGILKAGGAYIPIDPAYPAERIAFVLADARAPVLLTEMHLLTEGGLRGKLGEQSTRVLCLDRDVPKPGASVDEREAGGASSASASAHAAPAAVAAVAAATATDLAYVIYTSGSTGRPKGVQIEHRAVVNLLASMRRAPGLTAHDVLLAVTTLSFDIAALEIFLPLTTGATVVVAPRAAVGDPALLQRELTRSGATVMQATPVTWRLLVEAGWAGDRRLKILCGGEALSSDLATQLVPRCAELWNMYGPTETTIWSTCRRVTDSARIDIGRPIDNTEILILDERGQPQPIGLPGELLIGGDGLARGYLDRPELTAERFIAHPWRPGARLYRTGDRARWQADGTVAYLGRADFQIKVRGLRVEPGEIEAVLRTHPAVRESVVILREDTPGDQRLVAYVSGADAAAADLRTHLKGSLPDYMIPSAFVTVETWPLTPNGKLDRRALPPPSADRASADLTSVAPSTPTEQRLAVIWREVLGVTTVSACDDFFLTGGHSLLAIQLMNRVHQTFGVSLPPGALFEHPTLADLAGRIDAALPQHVLVRMLDGGKGTPFFWVHGIGGEVFSYMQISRHLAAARPVYGFTADWTRLAIRQGGGAAAGASANAAPGHDTGTSDGLTLEAMASHYVRELRALQPSGPYHVGGYCGAAMLVVEMARQLERAGQEVGVLAALDYEIVPQRPRLSRLATLRAFVRNLPYWVQEDARRSTWKDLRGRLRSGLRRVRRRLFGALRPAPNAPGAEIDPRDRLGMWRFPDHQVGMLAAHHRVIGSYQPEPFNARVTLFLPRAARLFGPWPTGHDPEWNRIAGGGVDVHLVRGSHSTMMTEPFAAELAAQLHACIEASEQRRTTRRPTPIAGSLAERSGRTSSERRSSEISVPA